MSRTNEQFAFRTLAALALVVFWIFGSTGCGADYVGREIGVDPAPTQDVTTTTTTDTTGSTS